MSKKEIYLEDVAVKLFYSLHSSENENIISSLLTASLNESEAFMRWFLINAARMHGNVDSRKFYATANVTIPEMLRGKKGKFHRYQHPDVFLLDSRCEEIWNRLSEGMGKGLASTLGDLRSVFIEVKHTNLSSEDREKYVRFNECISGKCNENWAKFVIISSHTKPALAKLKNNEWVALRKSIGEEKHIVLKDIYDAIKGLYKRRCKRYAILHVFESYLALVLGPTQVDDKNILWRYWADIIDDYFGGSCSSLKKEVTEYIEWLAKINGFSGGHWNRYKKDDAIEALKTITLDRCEYTTTFEGKNGKEDKLEVLIDSQPQPFVFNLSYKQKNRTIDDIVENVTKISGLLSEN